MAQLNDLIVTGKSRFLNSISGNITGTASNVTSTVAIANGGTGATTAANARTALGLGGAAVKGVTDTYSSTGTDLTTGKAIANALGTLNISLTGVPGSSNTLTAFSQINGKVNATFGSISITKSQISDFPTSMTPTSHTHGNIQNGGTLQTNDITIASGDKLVVTDSSDSSKLARTSISFDGSTTTQCLTKKGTWATFGTSNLTIGTTASTAMAGNTVVDKVYQYPYTSGESDHAVLIGYSTNVNSSETNYVGKASFCTFNPKNTKLTVGDQYSNISMSATTTSQSELYLSTCNNTGEILNKLKVWTSTTSADIETDSTWDGTNTSLRSAIGNKISDIKIIKVNIPCTSLTKNMSLATYVTSSLPSGYTFLGWQSCGCTNGWVSTFPFYLASVLSSTGSPWWEGALNTNTGCGVDFYYFAIKK